MVAGILLRWLLLVGTLSSIWPTHGFVLIRSLCLSPELDLDRSPEMDHRTAFFG